MMNPYTKICYISRHSKKILKCIYKIHVKTVERKKSYSNINIIYRYNYVHRNQITKSNDTS